MIRNIFAMNDEGEFHGYCEFYWNTGKSFSKGVKVNGERCGYWECYCPDGLVLEDSTGYYLDYERTSKTNAEGNCYIWCKEVVV